jgi:hypothetical protein
MKINLLTSGFNDVPFCSWGMVFHVVQDVSLKFRYPKQNVSELVPLWLNVCVDQSLTLWKE